MESDAKPPKVITSNAPDQTLTTPQQSSKTNPTTDPSSQDSSSNISPVAQEQQALGSSAPLNHESDNKTLEQTGSTADIMDENLDQALGHAADSIWSFASAVTGTVTSVVKEGQPGFENFRKNVTSHLAPLDTLGRDLTSQIGALAPTDASLANITGSMKSVAESVQRNAEAVEAAILAKANATEKDRFVRADQSDILLTGERDSEVVVGDPSVGLLALGGEKSGEQEVEEEIDVNEEIAKVGESIQNSLIGQTVGDLWTGLWGDGGEGEEEGLENEAAMPKTRFEQRIFELQANPDTYCEPAKDLDAFAQWSKSFVLDDNADSCIAILDSHDAIAELYERVVPRIVDEDTFWMRYFFAKHILEKEEERRKRLLERAEYAVVEGEDEEDGWGDDDWDDEAEESTQNEQAEVKTSSSDDADPSEPVESDTENKQTTVEVEEKNEEMNEEKKKTTKSSELAPVTNNTEKVAVDDRADDDWGDDDWE